jgi:hypothetical protein
MTIEFATGSVVYLDGGALEHDSEKWKPVFRKNHAQTKS